MNQDWPRERPHLAPLVSSMQTVLELADELYVRGRAAWVLRFPRWGSERAEPSEWSKRCRRMSRTRSLFGRRVVFLLAGQIGRAVILKRFGELIEKRRHQRERA